jgi:hypothetical protein
MPAGTTVVAMPDASCSGCTATDLPLAIDGKLDTSATLAPSTMNGGGTLRATSPTVFDAGNEAGAFIERPNMLVFSIYVRTYLGGQLQEQYQPVGDPSEIGFSESVFYGFPTTKPFDAIEFSLHMSPGTGSVLVDEFCSNVHL